MNGFHAPRQWFDSLDAEAAAGLVTASSDMALVLDGTGVIRDAAFSSDDLAQEFPNHRGWLGQPWAEAVAPDSQPKMMAMLADSPGRSAPRWRHLNLLSGGGAAVPVLCSLVPVGHGGRRVMVGRDLRPMSNLQQRLVQAQQSLERDYARLRDAETRYRVLFQMAAEPVLIMEAGTQKVLEANPAASLLLTPEGRGAARPLAEVFDAAGQQVLAQLLAQVRAAGRTEQARATLAETGREVGLTASLFRQQASSLILLRISAEAAGVVASPPSPLLRLAETAPDAFVVTDTETRVLAANAAFLELAQLASEDQARGEPLERWLGRPGVEVNVLASNLRQRGSVRLFATRLRGEYGAAAEVEVSAVTVSDQGRGCYGFAIRDVGARLPGLSREAPAGPRSVEQLTQLIGRVPLKDLVREATDMIERLCIEAALEMTGDNRASAAEMLGLSRQSLYVKLRRYGLGDLNGEAEEA